MIDGEPYEMKYVDYNSNIHIREFPRPALISFFIQHSNAVDVHNHLRQASLRLEKKWVTFDPYFRLAVSLFGINVVDNYRLARLHSILPCNRMKLNKDFEKDAFDDDENGYTMKRFAGILSTQLMFMAGSIKVTKYYVDSDGKLSSKIEDLGKSSISAKLNQKDDEDDLVAGVSVGTRMKKADKHRLRSVTPSAAKNKKKRKRGSTTMINSDIAQKHLKPKK